MASGRRLAVAILATHPPAALFDVVSNNDVGALTLVPGIGKKTAERLIIELRDRLSVPVLDSGDGGSVSAVADVRDALAGLGYGTDEIRDVLRELPDRRRFVDAAARRVEDAGCSPCVTSSSTRVSAGSTTMSSAPRSSSRRACARGRSTSSSGQRELKEHLRIVLEAARKREQPVDHLLFAGPPGLGKTTLAGIVATEMGVHLHVTSGPALERAGDLAAILTKLEDGDVLFIDEIHRLSRAVEEILYPAMEDFQLDIVVGKGPAASSIRLTMPPFTLVGATTRHGHDHRSVARPVRARRPARLLRGRRAAGDRRARRRHPRRAHRPRRRLGDRASIPWHASHRESSAATCA